MKWNLDGTKEELEDLADENYRLTGTRGFWFNDGVIQDEHVPYLFRYDGPHPEEIEFSKFTSIKDFRIA